MGVNGMPDVVQVERPRIGAPQKEVSGEGVSGSVECDNGVDGDDGSDSDEDNDSSEDDYRNRPGRRGGSGIGGTVKSRPVTSPSSSTPTRTKNSSTTTIPTRTQTPISNKDTEPNHTSP